ncbi:glycosyltransferase family 2 protein [Helicobacter sp. XJK30-2]|uniref:Glycosyltransferase family 2 protein n=1 Tax=Helicobacter zhangjianzhongii TaxID=2974574 RepID=A0ACC6FPI6_9HELI|nr:glycosyltransferase family 2 protein [Helicobacter sp. XJK30-2]MDL0081112.1 glycosyltransferase family 2 protein [Helicobacter sp. XJK30-2]
MRRDSACSDKSPILRRGLAHYRLDKSLRPRLESGDFSSTILESQSSSENHKTRRSRSFFSKSTASDFAPQNSQSHDSSSKILESKSVNKKQAQAQKSHREQLSLESSFEKSHAHFLSLRDTAQAVAWQSIQKTAQLLESSFENATADTQKADSSNAHSPSSRASEALFLSSRAAQSGVAIHKGAKADSKKNAQRVESLESRKVDSRVDCRAAAHAAARNDSKTTAPHAIACNDGKSTLDSISIIIPCFNEKSTIADILQAVQSVQIPYHKEIVIIDDCSTDGTREILATLQPSQENCSLKILYHDKNQGKGAALRTGITQASGDLVLIQDADLEYDPNEYPKLLAPFERGVADVVFGSRFVSGESHRVLYFWHRMGNGLLTLLSNMMTNLNLTDMETCYKVFKREIIQSISIEENRFGFEPEITAKIAKIKGIRIYEVGISYYGRTYEEGKKIGIKDGFRALWAIVKYRFKG